MKLNNFFLCGSTTLVDNNNIPQLPVGSELTPAEHVIEIASRLCYNSLDKLGTNPNFLQGLIKAGHMDVLEHSMAVFEMYFMCNNNKEVLQLELALNKLIVTHRYLGNLIFNPISVSEMDNEKSDSEEVSVSVIIGANLRTWLEIITNHNLLANNFVYQEISYSLCHNLHYIAPHIFSENIYKNGIHPSSKIIYTPEVIKNNIDIVYRRSVKCNVASVETSSGAIITPIAICNTNPYTDHATIYNQMVYMVSGASRAFSHQHVRHRKLSFSQLSQRYVDFVNKQHGDFVYPEKATDEQLIILREAFERIKNDYERLRSAGMKKEDARCILPNAAETSLVFSGTDEGLQHYFKLRTATDAQLEIRQIALGAMYMYKMAFE